MLLLLRYQQVVIAQVSAKLEFKDFKHKIFKDRLVLKLFKVNKLRKLYLDKMSNKLSRKFKHLLVNFIIKEQTQVHCNLLNK